jgi:hypothetical protein
VSARKVTNRLQACVDSLKLDVTPRASKLSWVEQARDRRGRPCDILFVTLDVLAGLTQ